MTEKIAILEDNPDNLELMVYLLELFDYTLVTATDGEKGLELVKREKPNLVICDINLPKLSGYDIVKQLKSDPALRFIPLIAVTAFSMVGDRDKIMASGFDHYISKPIYPEEFIIDIQRFLSLKTKNLNDSNQLKKNSELLSESKKTSILVVDNNKDNLELLNILLTSEGFVTILVETVSEALSQLEIKIPDLIISDLHLPHVNGIDLIRKIKQHKTFHSIPIIVLSSSEPVESERQQCIALGAHSLIMRPMEPTELIKIIKKTYEEIKGNL